MDDILISGSQEEMPEEISGDAVPTEPITGVIVPSDTFSREQELMQRLDVLAQDLSTNSLEFGWVMAELWNTVQEDFMEQSGGKEKKALSAFINFVYDREQKEIANRTTVIDRFRVCRYVPRTLYQTIVSMSAGIKPTFHQIRACIFTDGDKLDETKTGAMFDWCVENQWPTVNAIREQQEVVSPKEKSTITPAEKHWKLFIKLAQAIMQETDSGSERYKAAKFALDTWTTENSI